MTPTDPSRVLETLCAYWRSAALAAALDVDLFTALGPDHLPAPALARRCRVSAARLERLADYLVSLGLLAKRGGRYRSAADAARLLDRRSPHALADAVAFFTSPPIAAAFARLGDLMGHPSAPASTSRRQDVLWREFARTTLPLRRLYASRFADELGRRGLAGGRILDIGAGGSALGIELLRRHRTARLTVQDRAAVVGVALAHATRAGVGRRVTAVRGDARSVSLGGPFDLVLMINVLDYFDDAGRVGLVRRAHEALAPGGVLAVGAPLLDASRTSPPEAAAYDLLLLALGGDGRPSTAAELGRLLRAARFSGVTRVRGVSLVLARRSRAT